MKKFQESKNHSKRDNGNWGFPNIITDICHKVKLEQFQVTSI